MAKTIKVGRVVAVLAMAFLISPFYLVIYARVLCSSFGRIHARIGILVTAKGIKDCWTAREIDR